MADLISVLSTGKGTWGHVNGLINGEEWNKIYLLTNDFGKDTFKANDKTELIVLNFNAKVEELSKEIEEKLKDKVSGEVGVNFISGAGKEHMALISALMKLGIGFRLMVSTMEGVKEI
ncbi:hypothetical protein HOG16_00425 [Candidatus Woesearchaeota archaeon]|jgi:hypothetical protein|nr:hypothetical protein [Candidatus Woesearchaeota archaeon]MBT4322218.1 hypothetical protein [Candidatus Woesearchaeota archaeon]MBT4631238.1 hypothetical protein [Candidatus Woesearchaeota archaeon]